jgi:hypothetical protein
MGMSHGKSCLWKVDGIHICDAPQDFRPNDVIWAQDHKTKTRDQVAISANQMLEI